MGPPLAVLRGAARDNIPDLWSSYGTGDMVKIARQHARITGARYDEELLHVLAQTSSPSTPAPPRRRLPRRDRAAGR
ncbi:hypothetical protein IOE58_05520 [Brachybacterium sp. Marseille-Q2903]|uniref:Uncharacterized protein n=1 Tax=Brachybacterium epidermidis TaxID=2781983 RepID=A0ABR9VZP9_9MICO|nr:hypothetical protein [Brachybacterium epidermidis]MBE9403667.1 hypothetical protein [Brachybacterium epidermidis]